MVIAIPLAVASTGLAMYRNLVMGYSGEHCMPEDTIEEALIAAICSSDENTVRNVLADLDERDLVQMARLALSNDVDHALGERVAVASPHLARLFQATTQDGGFNGFLNAPTAALTIESREIVGSEKVRALDVCLVKGGALCPLYPPHILRQQNDMDIAVSDFLTLQPLADIFIERGFLPQILILRFDGTDPIGSVSLVRIDRSRETTAWCDVWIGAQPISVAESLRLDTGFWKRVVRHPGKCTVPSPIDSLRILCGEIRERQSLRLKDIFDFLALARVIDASALDYSAAEMNLAVSIVSRHATVLASAFQVELGWTRTWDARVMQLPARLDDPVLGPPAMDAKTAFANGHYARFVPTRGPRGTLAFAETAGALLVRTPLGTFIEERQNGCSTQS